MPVYLFALNDDKPRPDSGEDLADDDAARKWAVQISREINRNCQPEGNWAWISVFRVDGSPLDCEIEQMMLFATSTMKGPSQNRAQVSPPVFGERQPTTSIDPGGTYPPLEHPACRSDIPIDLDQTVETCLRDIAYISVD